MIEFELRGLDQFVGKSQILQKRLMRATLNPTRRGVRRVIKLVKNDIRSRSGIGRSIFGKKATGLNPLVTEIRTRFGTDGFETGIRLKGIPAAVEKGGKTQAHDIKAEQAHYSDLAQKYTGKRRGELFAYRAASSRRPVLAIMVGGDTIFRSRVRHPGGTIRAHGFAAMEMEREGANIGQEANLGVAKLIEEVFSGQQP